MSGRVNAHFKFTRMLIGEYRHTIDSKKRLSMPAKFREELGRTVIATRGFENCLVVYTAEEWKEVSQKLSKLPSSQTEARAFTRIVLAGAMAIDMDKLGRILIPDYLKEYAGLGKEVVVCGLSNRLEIWDAKAWEQYRQKAEKEIGDLGAKLGELGI
jgi:MraZ protein